MKRSDVFCFVQAEQKADDALRVQQLAERIVGVLPDVPEQRLGQEHNLKRRRFNCFPNCSLASASVGVELLGGRLVLVVAPSEVAIQRRSLPRHELRVAVHQTLDIPR